MQNGLSELLETAMYKEIASQSFYIAGQQKTDDPGARALMKELAEEELRHSQMLKELERALTTTRADIRLTETACSREN